MSQDLNPALDRDEWAMLVGRFILLFGDIENVTYLALAQLPPKANIEVRPHPSFANRVNQVVNVMTDISRLDQELVTRFVNRLNAARRLAETRNHIAHSPLMMTIYEHPKEGWQHQEVALANARNSVVAMSFHQLEDAVAEAEGLVNGLYELFSRICQCADGPESA